MKLFAALSLLAATVGLGLCLASARSSTSAAPTSTAAVETFEIDPVHSTVIFKIKHMGVSYVFGRFDHLQGPHRNPPPHVVPHPGSRSTCSSPPSTARRSDMPCRPVRYDVLDVWDPAPRPVRLRQPVRYWS